MPAHKGNAALHPGSAGRGYGKGQFVQRRIIYLSGIVADARLHDLRHSHASHAVMNGESLHVAGRLLGHRRASTTNRYVHLDDATLSRAAERVAMAIQRKLRILGR